MSSVTQMLLRAELVHTFLGDSQAGGASSLAPLNLLPPSAAEAAWRRAKKMAEALMKVFMMSLAVWLVSL